MKNAMAIQAMENRLNVMAEAINSLIDLNPNIDLEAFKATFLKELAALLDQDSEFEFSNSLFDLLGTERTDLQNSFSSLEWQIQVLAEKVSKIESALGHEKN
jgi:predicted  nucleic acid-binding Zn-ribbon protein